MKTLFLAVATISIASVAVMACLFLRETRQAVAHADALILQETTELHGTSQNLNAVLIQSGLVADEARRAATEQRTYWNHLGKQSEGILSDTDHALKVMTLDIHDTLQTVQSTTGAAHSSIDSLTLDFDDLHGRIDDPRIDAILGNVQSTTFELAGTTADVHAEIHKLVFPPPRKWYQKYLLDPAKVAAHLITIPITSF